MLWYYDVNDCRVCVSTTKGLLIALATCIQLVRLVGASCEGQVTNVTAGATASYLLSPNYDQGYANNMLCKWLITAYKHYEVIRFEMVDLALPESANCGGDYVEIKDGSQSYSSTIKKYCGYGPKPAQNSTDRSITVIFKSDSKDTDRGFKLAFWTVPKGEIRYLAVQWNIENWVVLGLFMLTLSSILLTLAIITTIRFVPRLYDKFLKEDVPARVIRRPPRKHDTEETLCYSSRTVLTSASTSTLNSPL